LYAEHEVRIRSTVNGDLPIQPHPSLIVITLLRKMLPSFTLTTILAFSVEDKHNNTLLRQNK